MIPLSVSVTSVNTVLSEVWNSIGQDNDDKDNLMISPSCKLLPYNQYDRQLTLLYQEKYILPPGILQLILKALELTIKNPFWHPRGLYCIETLTSPWPCIYYIHEEKTRWIFSNCSFYVSFMFKFLNIKYQ